jgi:REP element-mobilizing transposase RayT
VRQFYARAREALAFPLLEIGAAERAMVGDAFAETVAARRYTCYVCAILPDHVHLVVRKHRDKAEQMIEALQDASRLRLRRAGLLAPDHPVWSVGGWKRFLERPEAVRSTIAYIEGNPAERGFRRRPGPSSCLTTAGPFIPATIRGHRTPGACAARATKDNGR